MIKFLQSGNKAAKYILAGFLLILAASMVTYLIPGFMGDTGTKETGVVASIGGREIHREEIARAAQSLAQRMAQGRQVPDFYVAMMRPEALRQLIQQAEIQYES